MKVRVRLLVMVLLAVGIVSGCGIKDSNVLDPKTPTVITLWHAYNAYAKAVFDKKVTEFNETVGLEKGIIVDAYVYGSSEELDEALFKSANQIIGSDPLPDLICVYPDSACRLDQLAPLVELDQYFSAEELERYCPEFLAEGIWGGDTSPKMIPVSKSTELLFLNDTDWKRFSKQAGLSEQTLSTWEGLAQAGRAYYEWSGGQPFMGINGFNEFIELTAAQSGVIPFDVKGEAVDFQYPREVARKVWDLYYVPHINGWYKSEIFNQDGIKSGKLIAYIGSSGGAGYFPKEVIVSEDQVYPIECRVLPYPYIEGGKRYAPQRGANMAVFSSDEAHEYASAEFLKWLTRPDENIELTSSIGYLPVVKEALASVPEILEQVQDFDNHDAVTKSVRAALETMEEGIFYSKKTFSGAYAAHRLFSESLDNRIASDLNQIELRTSAGEERSEVIAELLGEENFDKWYNKLLKEMAGILDEPKEQK